MPVMERVHLLTNVDIALTCSGFRAAHSLWYSRMGSIKVLKTSAFVAVVTVLLSNMCFRNLPNARLAVSTLCLPSSPSSRFSVMIDPRYLKAPRWVTPSILVDAYVIYLSPIWIGDLS